MFIDLRSQWEPIQPPLNRQWLPAVLAAWTLTPVLLWTNGFQVPQVDSQPPKPGVQSLASWEAEHVVVQGRRFVPQGDVSGPQPYASALNQLVASWAQEPLSLQQRRYVPQETAAAVDIPIPGGKPSFRAALDSWAQSPVLLWQNGFITQDVAAQVPFTRAREAAALRSWEPEPYAQPARRYFVQTPATTADDPPFGARPWLASVVSSWQQDWAWQRPELIVQGAPEDNPPFGANRSSVARQAWEPDSWSVPQRTFQPPAVAAAVDDPPSLSKALFLARAAESWQQNVVTLLGKGFFPQSVAVVDAPPPLSRTWLNTLNAIWNDPVEITITLPSTPEIVDNPPFIKRAVLDGVLTSWIQEFPTLQRRVLAVQGTPAQVDNPPFGLRPWLQTVMTAWEPVIQPTLKNFNFKATFIVQEGPAVTEVQDWLIQARRRERR